MKGKKCFGLLLLLSIMVGLSLSVFSEDTNALKHDYLRIPLYNPNYYVSDGTNSNFIQNLVPDPDFGFTYSEDISSLIDVDKTSAPLYFNPDPITSSSSCWWGNRRSNGHMTLISGTNSSSLKTYSRFIYDTPGSYATDSYCISLYPFNSPVGDSRTWDMSWSTIPIMYGSYSSLNPYSYDYASYFLSDSRTVDGVVYDYSGFTLARVFDGKDATSYDNTRVVLNHPSSFNIPIGVIHDIQSEDFTDISVGTNLTFTFELFFDNLSSNDLSVINASVPTLYWSGSYDPYLGRGDSGSVTCAKDIFSPYSNTVGYTITCSWTSTHDYPDNYVGFNIKILPGSNQTHIWDLTFDSGATDPNMGFTSQFHYVVTDYDDTPGSSIGGSSEGGDLSNAPGSVYGAYFDDNINWFASLKNLFGFNFLNPFAPLFTTFTDQSQCVSIPTIAGMLGSDETTYCPWFSATTRNILTPVLSIVSMMLIFGFAVRWLSSSSGNMFEDQTTHKWGNTQFKQGGK